MKTGLLSWTISVAIAVLMYFSFDINRLLPIGIQWIHAVFVVILLCRLFWLMTKLFHYRIRNEIFKTHIVCGPLA
jgi:hypothetical protein